MATSETSTAASAPVNPKAWLALILGLVGCLIAPVAPAAWVVGRQALRTIEASDGAWGGRSHALVGKWLGIAVSVALLAVVVFGIALAVWAVLQLVITFS